MVRLKAFLKNSDDLLPTESLLVLGHTLCSYAPPREVVYLQDPRFIVLQESMASMT